MPKVKKQFRLFDIYRYIATGEQSHIQGILSYDIKDNVLTVRLERPDCYLTYWTYDEKMYKYAVRDVNKVLHNCEKPGPKHSENYKFALGDKVITKSGLTKATVTALHRDYFLATVDGVNVIKCRYHFWRKVSDV